MKDDDITHALDQAADPPVATTDSFRDVMARYRRGRTRTLVAALAGVTLLGPAVGIAVGRATAHRPVQVATAGQSQTDSAAKTDPRFANSSGSSVASRGFVESHKPDPAKRLFVRTTADGVTIRADLRDNLADRGGEKCEPEKASVPCPATPPECVPTTQIQAGLSDAGAVDPGFAMVNPADQTGPLAVLFSSYFGVLENDPAAWAIVKADPGVARVRVHFSDGTIDEMAPVDGYAILAHRTPAPALPANGFPVSPDEAEAMQKTLMPQGSADALDSAGSVVATADLASVKGPFSKACVFAGGPPPTPGVGGPSDLPAVPETAPAATTSPAPVPATTSVAPAAVPATPVVPTTKAN